MYDLAIVVGHTPKAQGNTNFKGESEFSFNTRIANSICEYLTRFTPIKSIVCNRPDLPYSRSIKRFTEQLKDQGIHLSLHLHFNGFDKPAKGCECVVLADNEQAKDLGTKICASLLQKFNIKPRGALKGILLLSNANDRGYGELKAMKDIAKIDCSVIVEPTFGNFETTESKLFFSNEDKYTYLLIEIIEEFFRGSH